MSAAASPCFGSGLDFVAGAAGGIAIGLLVGMAVAEVRKRLDDPPVEITISLATAYAAYLPAEELGLSGVLAAVTAGIYLGWRAPEISSVRCGCRAAGLGDLQFLLNATLFVLVGLQLPAAGRAGRLLELGAGRLRGGDLRGGDRDPPALGVHGRLPDPRA